MDREPVPAAGASAGDFQPDRDRHADAAAPGQGGRTLEADGKKAALYRLCAPVPEGQGANRRERGRAVERRKVGISVKNLHFIYLSAKKQML